MEFRHILPIIIVAVFNIQWTLGFLDPVTLGFSGLGIGFLGAAYQKYVKCQMFECCNDDYIPIDLAELQRRLITQLHGQHIVQRTIIRAIHGYKATENPPKALALSFHGSVGTGKNFVSRIISETFYRKGKTSEYFHQFSGSAYSMSHLEHHKESIKNIIVESLLKCDRSMFVFDEVDSMPEGLLEVLLPFMDYGQPIFVDYKSKQMRIKSNRAVFIFLGNAGASRILSQMLDFWKAGKKRDSIKLEDFENLLSNDALENGGGFLNSNTIKSSLIDYYLPFLPLEEEHVKLCMRDAFASFIPDRSLQGPTPLQQEEVLSIVTYGPEPYNIYSNNGCKKIEQKVISTRAIEDESAL